MSGRARAKPTSVASHGSKSSVKLAVFVLAVLVVVIILSKFITFLISLHQPFSPDILVQKSYTWNGKSSLNLAIKGSTISILNFDPVNNQVTILNVPNDTYFDLPKGFGSWPVASIYELGQEEKKPVGAELLKQSLAKLLGLPVDGYIIINDPKLAAEPLDQTITSWKNPLNMVGFFRNISTDLTPIEASQMLSSISKVRSDKITYLDIGQSNITVSKLLADDSRVLGVNTVALDVFIRDKMSDPDILQEAAPVAIFNATDHPGLAADAARVITNLGGNVIFTANITTHLQESLMVYKNPSQTENRLGQIFSPRCLDQSCQVNDSRIQSQRADINIVLGEDFYENLYSR